MTQLVTEEPTYEQAAGPDDVEGIWRAARSGRAAAWQALTDRYSRLVSSTIRSFGLQQADAADMYQQTWLKLIENAASVRDPRALPGWLVTTARRECLAFLKRGQRQVPLEQGALDGLTVARENPEHLTIDAFTRSAVWHAVDALPPERRRLIRALYGAEATYAEIADMFGMPVGSIGPTRARCMAAMRPGLASAGVRATA